MPSRDSKRNQYGNYGYANGRNSGAPRNHVIPTEPPFTAYIGNAPDSMVQGDFENHLFVGLKVKQVRLVRDRQTDRFRGFAYVDFEDEDSLRRAIALDGTCVNDRSIRIDVAARPLGANKNEGFRNKSGFESRDGRRVPSENHNRFNDGFRPGGRRKNNYNQEENFTDSHNQSGYKHGSYPERNRHSSSSEKNYEHRQQRKISNDDVFTGPDTPASNEDSTDQANDQNTTITRQASRNWADCPIDETTTEPSPPSSANNTFATDDFQIVRNKNIKARTNQQSSSSRPTGNQYGRGRNNGNNYREGTSEIADGHNYYEQNSTHYANHSQQPFYHPQQQQQQQQQGSPHNHMGSSYRSNNNNRQPPSSETRQRLNSNRSNTSRHNNDDNERTKQRTNENSNDINNNSVSSETRPRLQLLPRSQKISSSVESKPTAEPSTRNSSIFGCGKPRDERDPKIAELNKHIEEIVEKEQHIPRTKSTTSDGSIDVITKPVRILTAAKNSLVDH